MSDALITEEEEKLAKPQMGALNHVSTWYTYQGSDQGCPTVAPACDRGF